MEKKCSVTGCLNRSRLNPSISYHRFPSELKSCMVWVERAGNLSYMEDFAYSGALPFIKRYICSNHFHKWDFITEGDIFSGLKPEAVPYVGTATSFQNQLTDIVVNNHEVFIKQEDDDEFPINCTNNNSVKNNPLDQAVKTEIDDDEDEAAFSYEDNNSSTSFSSETYGLTEDDPLNSVLLNLKKRRRRKKSEVTEEEVNLRKQRDAMRVALKRKLETEEQRSERLRKDAERAALRRQRETDEEKVLRRQKDCIRSRVRRQNETEEEASVRRYNDAVRAAFRRQLESDEEKGERRYKNLMRAQTRRSNESVEQRAERLRKDRERIAKKRELLKLSKHLSSSFGVFFDDLQSMGSVDLGLHQNDYSTDLSNPDSNSQESTSTQQSLKDVAQGSSEIVDPLIIHKTSSNKDTDGQLQTKCKENHYDALEFQDPLSIPQTRFQFNFDKFVEKSNILHIPGVQKPSASPTFNTELCQVPHKE